METAVQVALIICGTQFAVMVVAIVAFIILARRNK